MDLIKILTERLGVSTEQAEQGAGMLFQKVKENLSDGDFSKVASAVPGVEQLIGKAPAAEASESGGLMGMLGGVASNLGMGNVSDIADLTAGFDKIGLDAGQLKEFAATILEFVESKLGIDGKALIEKVLQ